MKENVGPEKQNSSDSYHFWKFAFNLELKRYVHLISKDTQNLHIGWAADID